MQRRGSRDAHDGGADRHNLARLRVQLGHDAREWARQFDGGLSCLDFNEWLVHGDDVADLDMPDEDLTLGQPLANVREREHLNLVGH